MKHAKAFVQQQRESTLNAINTALVGEIERYDHIQNKADITLLPDGDLVTNIPMGQVQTSEFFIRVPYKKGDKVLVIFSQRDIDGIFQGENATPTDRKFSLDDAIGAIGVNEFNDPLPAADPDKLVIGQKDGAAKITIGGGKTTFHGEVEFTGVTNLNGSTTVGGTALSPGSDNF